MNLGTKVCGGNKIRHYLIAGSGVWNGIFRYSLAGRSDRENDTGVFYHFACGFDFGGIHKEENRTCEKAKLMLFSFAFSGKFLFA